MPKSCDKFGNLLQRASIIFGSSYNVKEWIVMVWLNAFIGRITLNFIIGIEICDWVPELGVVRLREGFC